MPQITSARQWFISIFTVFTVMATGSLVALVTPASAGAVVSEVAPRSSKTVTADALPTAQMNGVAWDQEIIGNTVYVGGNFSQARPAGAVAGANQTPRSNLMAYTLSNGVMTSWSPSANAQVRTVASSPDGSRLYVGGDFTQISGQARSRIAAFDRATGQLIGNFAPPVGYQVNDIVATGTTVYVAGSYAGVGSQPRANLSAFDAATGNLLGWAPTADRQVLAIDLSSDGTSVVVGGHFENINGVPTRGLAKLNATTGALQPWPVAISNAGPDAAVNSLHVEGDVVFGTSFHFGPGGNMEGPWQVRVSTGELVWVADCHGDTYDAYPSAETVYTVGHQHYCGNTSMGFPQYKPWRFQHSMAWTREATGTNIREIHGYANWDGRPSPSIVSWLPSMSIGSFTRQYQAGWTVEGNDDYVVIGGEFPRVNNTAQQGLVRFAKAPIAPQKRGPAFASGTFVPTVQAVAPGAAKISWTAGYDMDDRDLTYQVVRSPGGIVHTTEAASVWWDTPGLSYVDTGLTPGQSYSYSLRVRDASGNQVFGSSRSITVPTSFVRNAYGAAVLGDEPEIYWPLNETDGAAGVADHAGGYAGTPGSAVSYGVPGAIAGDAAVSVNNNNNGRIHAQANSHAPTEMSAEVWFRTTVTSGRLLGHGDLMTGNSARRDRQIYLANDGRVHFGVLAKGYKIVSGGQRYNDNEWHQAVATLTGSSQRLYVDGVLVAQRHDVVEPEEYVGHWRLGGDNQAGWPNAGNNNFTGGMDELSIYDYALTPQQVNAHYVASGRTSTLPPAPRALASDTFGRTVDSGFGRADLGGAWSPTGSGAPFSVSQGVGSIRMAAAGSGPRIYLPALSQADVDIAVRVSLDKAPLGGDTYLTVAARRVDNSEYRLKTRLLPNGTTMVLLSRSLSGVETNLASATVSGLTYRAGDVLNMRLRAVGTGTTTLSGKVWRAGQSEPTGWQVAANDTSAGLQGRGGLGLQTYISGSSTNVPVVARFDELMATSPE